MFIKFYIYLNKCVKYLTENQPKLCLKLICACTCAHLSKNPPDNIINTIFILEQAGKSLVHANPWLTSFFLQITFRIFKSMKLEEEK